MMSSNILIRSLKTIEELKEVQKLESMVWNMSAIPVHQTFTAVKNGGIMLGAYHHGELVGFNYGFPGYKDEEVSLCSHMMGIHPAYRKQNIGYLLKNKQREIALEKGYRLMTWTFDPLESVNGYLNIHKLRGIGAVYFEDMYGSMGDDLSKGVPTDRFQIEWWLDQSHLPQSASMERNTEISEERMLLTYSGKEQPRPGKLQALHAPEGPWYVPVPYAFQQLKQEEYDLSLEWRLNTREAFRQLFAAGYVATDLKPLPEQGVSWYLFVPKASLR